MTDLKRRLDQVLTDFEPTGDAWERTIALARRRQRARRIRGRSISALVVVAAMLAVLLPIVVGNHKSTRQAVAAFPVTGLAIVAARHDGAVLLLSTGGKVIRTLVAAGTGVAKWGEPVSMSVSEADNAVYIGYEILTATRYSARIERVSLDGGAPVFVADGAKPAVSPDGTELAYVRESSGRCQASRVCPPVDVNEPLVVRNLVSGSEHELPASHSPGVSGLSWSDDDVHLAVSDGNGFWAVDTSSTGPAASQVAIFPPANSIPPYWSDAQYRGSSGSIGVLAFCPETVGCDQTTDVLNVDPFTEQATLLAHLDFGAGSLTFDSSGQTFAYVGLTPGTAVPSPLQLKPCAAAELCMSSARSWRLIAVDTLLMWHNGTTTKLGSGYISVALSGTGTSTPPAIHKARQVLFTHVAPDGSRVTAKAVSIVSPNCTTTVTYDCSAQGTGHTPGVEFDFTVNGRQYREVVADNDERILDPGAGIMAPLFGTIEANDLHSDARLIILHVRAPVAEVRLAPSGPGGAAPLGDRMAPVDGWVAIPIHNFTNLARPEAFDAKGKLLGSSLPFPCC